MIVAVLAWGSVGQAGIIGLDGADDGDGAVNCTGVAVFGYGQPSGELTLDGTQSGGLGHILGTIDTDTPEDPTIKYINSITNEMDFGWSGYIVNFTLQSRLTSITSGSLSLATPAVATPTDWTGQITQQLAYVGDVVIGGTTYKEYQGQITYTSGGTLVMPNSDLDFTYSLANLAGSTRYLYTQEMIPVPEPASLALLGTAAMALMAYAWRRRSD
jgi:hypothetical protein